jgi:hypothetical protein
MSENTPPPEPPRPPGGSDTPPPPPPGAPPPPPPPSTPPGGGGQGDSSGGWGSPPPGGPSDPNGPSGWGTPPPPPPPGGPGGPGGYGAGGYGGGPGGGYGGGPESYSVGNAFSYAFEKFKANWGPLVLITLLLLVASVVVNLLSQLIFGGVGQTTVDPQTGQIEGGGLFGVAMILSLLSSALVFAVQLVIQSGIIKGALSLSRNEPLTIGSAFSGINWGQVVLASIITGAMIFVGLILCIIPGIVVAFLTSYTLYFVIDRNMSAIDAIKASFTMVKDNVGQLLLFFLATIAAVIVGACLCGVGLLAAIPIVVLAQVYTFRTLNGDPVQA